MIDQNSKNLLISFQEKILKRRYLTLSSYSGWYRLVIGIRILRRGALLGLSATRHCREWMEVVMSMKRDGMVRMHTKIGAIRDSPLLFSRARTASPSVAKGFVPFIEVKYSKYKIVILPRKKSQGDFFLFPYMFWRQSRYYPRMYRASILAVQLCTHSTAGSERLCYSLG